MQGERRKANSPLCRSASVWRRKIVLLPFTCKGLDKKPENNWGHCASAVTRKPHRLSSVRFWVSSKEFWSVEMCNYQPWEEDSLQSADYVQSTAEGVDVAETRWGARLAMLEARVTRVEARVERLEAKMLHLQKGMRVVCALFLVTLMYAIFK
ncbi:unnamed protein product [Prunus armeniaca]|uniref:Uncharacterized protein n=1 Tax=Prunus armeniaca TaxID=36596 RepID=A0A6J5VMI9_PRUAR|nr:unnamed protein product [Prunus armeniaca]